MAFRSAKGREREASFWKNARPFAERKATLRRPTINTEIRRRLTCKWLGLATLALFILIAGTGFLMPPDLARGVVQVELWHAGVTAALLLWGWRDGELTRQIAGIALALGILYLAPVIFMAGLLMMPPDTVTGRDNIVLALVYMGLLLAFYGTALVIFRRANKKPREAVQAQTNLQ